MCGIAGWWGMGAPDLRRATFEAFVGSMAHRGPDGAGVTHFAADRLWLGHRRLAIVDVSDRGRQPMSYANERYWLTFNGEIYNYIELRALLRQHGHEFQSDTDSEVILAAYAEWGPACQYRFNGMWALAIWDSVAQTLFLSRDRFGVKPLHYSEVEGSFAFASELKSFTCLPWCDGGFDSDMVRETIAAPNAQESTPWTLLPGVRRLPAGHCLTASRAGIAINRWWDTLDHLPEVQGGLAEQAVEFRRLFFDACRLRMRSDVPVATSLSGGLDSSAVACAVARLGAQDRLDHAPQDWQRAFVACFPDSRLDERAYADQVIDHSGMRPHHCVVDEATALRSIERVVFDLEGIFFVPLVGAWAIYQAMRDAGIRVSLDGHGADEMLGGYHAFVEQALMEMYGRHFRPGRYLDLRRVRNGLADATSLSGSGARLGASSVLKELRSALGDYAARAGLAADRSDDAAATGRLVRGLAGAPRLAHGRDDPRMGGWSGVRRSMHAWFHQSLLPTFLRNIDRASMAHGIEVRTPFLDWRLVAFTTALPDAAKIGGGFTKRVLREAMRGLMPEPIRTRTNKFHFSSPIGEWSRGALAPWLLDLSASRSFLEAPEWDGPAARLAIADAVAGRSDINPVWPLINAHVLKQGFRDAARTRPDNQRETAPIAA
jgi:asparagine synthase (glutamine-hydrolysing)